MPAKANQPPTCWVFNDLKSNELSGSESRMGLAQGAVSAGFRGWKCGNKGKPAFGTVRITKVESAGDDD
jgi:hypothetical protein